MTQTHPQKNIFSKILPVFFLASFLFAPLSSYASLTPTIPTSSTPTIEETIPLESVINIPKMMVGEKVISDISRVDWGQEVILNGKSVALNSEEALNTLAISDNIKEIIKLYRDEKTAIGQKRFILLWIKTEPKKYLDDGLKFSIAKSLIDQGIILPKDYLELDTQDLVQPQDTMINVSNTKTLDPAVLTGVEPTVKIINIKTIDTKNKTRKVSAIQKSGVGVLVSEKAIAYLATKQNADGSWGTNNSTKFITTVAVLEAFHAQGITNTATDKGIEWISAYFADNNDYMAQKLKVIISAGEPASTAEILVYDQDTVLGGFPFDGNYKVDPLTTARVIQALFAAGYENPGDEPNATQSLALKYLINTKRFDNGWSVFPGGVSSIPVSSEVIEALLLWKHRTLGATKVDDTLLPAVSSLTSTQKTNGTWGDNILNTALAYHVIKTAGGIPVHQLETVDYFEGHQASNGSFENDLYTTAKVLKALSISTDSGKLVITDIAPLVTLQTGIATEFNIVMTNTGNTAVDTGLLHIIADGYHTDSFDFRTYGIVVNAGSTINLTVEISNTRNYLGNVLFKVFVEGTNSVIHPGSLYEETLSYAPDSTNRSALPMYFVAYKSVSSTGLPAITWRWPVKTDPNLINVRLMYRKMGITAWSYYDVISPTRSDTTLQGFQQDQLYEITLGTLSQNGLVYFYSTPVQVKASSNPSDYIAGSVSGKVKSLGGAIAGVDVLGVTASTTATSLENGDYTQNNVPWGSGYARVSNFRYENYVKKYETSNNALSLVDVYTNLKPDTQDPIVTNVFIVGESDKIMLNNSTKLIQYSVNDDIGLNGNGIIESASFYYFDPHDSTWHLIGFDYGLLTGTRTYAWNIPGNLLGKGFKIKVIARDFAGKDSAEAEWGDTFEIIAPPPYVPSSGSENGNEFPDIPAPSSAIRSGNSIPSSDSSNENEIPNIPEPQIEIPSSGSESGNEI